MIKINNVLIFKRVPPFKNALAYGLKRDSDFRLWCVSGNGFHVFCQTKSGALSEALRIIQSIEFTGIPF